MNKIKEKYKKLKDFFKIVKENKIYKTIKYGIDFITYAGVLYGAYIGYYIFKYAFYESDGLLEFFKPFIILIISSLVISLFLIFVIWLWKKIKNRKNDNIISFFEIFRKKILKFSILIIVYTFGSFFLAISFFKIFSSTLNKSIYLPRVYLENDSSDKIVYQYMLHDNTNASFYEKVLTDIVSKVENEGYIYFDETTDEFWKNKTRGDRERYPLTYVFFNTDWHTEYGMEFSLNLFYNDLLESDLEYLKRISQTKFFINNIKKLIEHYPNKYMYGDTTDSEMEEYFKNFIDKKPDVYRKNIEILKSRIEIYKNKQENENKISKSFSLFLKEETNYTVRKFFIDAASINNLSHYQKKNKQKKDNYQVFMNSFLLDFRNEKLVQKVLNTKGHKKYIAFGGAHMSGIFKELKKNDSTWKVKKTEWVLFSGGNDKRIYFHLDPETLKITVEKPLVERIVEKIDNFFGEGGYDEK